MIMHSVIESRRSSVVLGSSRLARWLALGAFAFTLGLADPTWAAENKKDFSMSPWVASQLTEAREQIGEKKYKDALETLDSARERGKLSPHEKAMVTQTEGYVHSAKGDYKRAAAAFEKTLATEAVPDQAVLELHYNLGQLYQIQKEFKKALVHLLKWVRLAEKPKAKDFYMIATAYVQAEMHSKAIPWARKAVDAPGKPKEAWLQLLSSLLFERATEAKGKAQDRQFRALLPVLDQVSSLYPKKLYYDQIFAVHAKLAQYHDALAILILSHEQGFLQKEDELMNFAIMYKLNGLPMKAAEVMEEAFKNKTISKKFETLQLYAESLLEAKELERAIKPLNQAAKLDRKKGAELYMRVAEIHVSKRRWGKARAALNKALATGHLDDKGTAYLLLGIANFRDQKTQQAAVAFQKAKSEKRTRKAAETWLAVMKSMTSSEEG